MRGDPLIVVADRCAGSNKTRADLAVVGGRFERQFQYGGDLLEHIQSLYTRRIYDREHGSLD